MAISCVMTRSITAPTRSRAARGTGEVVKFPKPTPTQR
jgi:hypothetical protein